METIAMKHRIPALCKIQLALVPLVAAFLSASISSTLDLKDILDTLTPVAGRKVATISQMAACKESMDTGIEVGGTQVGGAEASTIVLHSNLTCTIRGERSIIGNVEDCSVHLADLLASEHSRVNGRHHSRVAESSVIR